MLIREDSHDIAVLRLAHGKVSALDVEFCHAIVNELQTIASGSSRALVLTGTGSAFSAGVDLFRVLQGGSEYLAQFLPAMEAFFQALLAFPKPLIAAINGHAIAGGCIIGAACDYRVMAEGNARIGVPELVVGVPFPTLPFEIVRVLDLYSGSGLFTVPLAARGHHVTAVEENRQAIEDADANLRLNRIRATHVRLHAQRVEDAMPRLQRDRFETVILDPPRQGCPPDVLSAVFGRVQPHRVIYVSCNPEALAAEMPSILDAGYVVDRVQPVDMFPHTTHIETVATFSRRSVPRTRASAPARPHSPTPRARRH